MKRKYREGGGKKEGSAIDEIKEQEEEEEEEEKINTFYNLVRNIQEVHNQMLIGSGESKQNRKEKQKEEEEEEEEPMKSTWTPSFTLEDFAEDELFRPQKNANSSKDNEQPKIEQKRQDFDLNCPV